MKFSKLQAAGNDFIVIDARAPFCHPEQSEESHWPNLAQTLCRRKLGIGADGLILVQTSQVADLKMRIFNPDGSEAEACGNGLRCFTKYAIEKGIVGRENLTIETLSGIRKTKAYMAGKRLERVEVSMGLPQFKPEQIPTSIKVDIMPILNYPLVIGERELTLALLSMGNPHVVSFLSESVTSFPLTEIGPEIERHPMFPQRVNFEIARVLGREKIEARVWERGVGETFACGSGACAIAVAAQLLGYVDRRVDIILPGGILTVCWDGLGEVSLAGPVETVFEGEWHNENLLREEIWK